MKVVKKYIPIIIILIITFILLINLFVGIRYFKHDTTFHAANIIELSRTISIKNIFGDKIVTYGCNKFGYGIGFFYPRLPHTLAAYINIIVDNAYTSMNIIYFITTFLSGIAMFFLSKKVFNNKIIALLSAVIYLTIPYHLCEIYIRDAFAENFIFLSSPLIFLGLYHLKDNDYKRFYINFILGYIIGMYSHLVSMVFCTMLVAIFIIYHHKEFLKKEKIKAIIISTLIVIGLTLPLLTTIIEYKLTDNYTVFLSDTFTTRNSVLENTISLKSYIKQDQQSNGIQTYFSYTSIILFIITTMQVILNKTEYKKKVMPIIIFIILLILTVSCKIIWKHIPDFFLMIQFPWRLLAFLSLFISLYVPICLTKIKIKNKIGNISYVLLFVLIVIEGLINIKNYNIEQLEVNETTNKVLAMGEQQEYLPYKTTKIKDPSKYPYYYVIDRENKILTSIEEINLTITKDNFPNLIFEVNNIEVDNIKESIPIELPRVYYLGYELKDKKGNKIKLYMNEKGFLGANIKENGKYILTHSKTTIEKISVIICLMTIIICIFALMRCKKWIIKK